MNPVQRSRFTYAATIVFLCAATAGIILQKGWLLLLPVGLLFYIWTFEKPIVLLYLLLASIPWSVEYQFSGTLGTDFPDEPLMLLSALTTFLLLVYNHKIIRWKQVLHPLLWLLLLQLIWASCTVVTSTHPLLSLKFLAAKSWYLFSFVLFPLLLIDTKKKLRTAALVLASSMMLLVLISLARHAAAGFTFAAINNSLTPFFRNHVNYSALLVCIIPLLFLFLKFNTARRRNVLLVMLLFIGLMALYVSYARGAWVALMAGVLAYGLLKKKALLIAFFSTVVFTVTVVFYLQHNDRYLQYAPNHNKTIFHTDFAEHLVATYQLKDMSTAERFYRWIAGMHMIRDRWQTGFGPNTFYRNYRSYTVPAFKTWVSANEEQSTVHNYFLLLLVEQGVIGLLLFLAVLAFAFYTAQRLYHATNDVFWKMATAAVAVILVMICTVNFLSDLIETDKIGSVFYLCLAVLMIADKTIKSETSQLSAHVERIA